MDSFEKLNAIATGESMTPPDLYKKSKQKIILWLLSGNFGGHCINPLKVKSFIFYNITALLSIILFFYSEIYNIANDFDSFSLNIYTTLAAFFLCFNLLFWILDGITILFTIKKKGK